MTWLVVIESKHDTGVHKHASYERAESHYEEKNPSKGETVYLASVSRQKECKVVEIEME